METSEIHIFLIWSNARHRIREIEKDIDKYLGLFREKEIQWEKPHLTLKTNSRANKPIEDGLVLAVAGRKAYHPVKFLDKTSLFVEDKYWSKQDFDYPDLEDLNICFELDCGTERSSR